MTPTIQLERDLYEARTLLRDIEFRLWLADFDMSPATRCTIDALREEITTFLRKPRDLP